MNYCTPLANRMKFFTLPYNVKIRTNFTPSKQVEMKMFAHSSSFTKKIAVRQTNSIWQAVQLDKRVLDI
jgi:hypothetical protein